MKHKNRGQALIFNQMHYDDETACAGAEVDSNNLERELKRLDFHVSVYEDYCYEQIQQTINEVAAQDHSDSDCILVAVLSHGEQGHISAEDPVEYIWDPFTSDNCPSLAGKPKLFFIQTSQGTRLMEGTALKFYSLESDVDFLIAYSTISGFFWRNTKKGSVFIQSLCAELEENGKQLDLLTLLTFVCQRVAINFESHPPDNGMKQISCIATTLTRILRFEDK
ncbi:hypothetical protein KR059_012994 [Drosophila kikkawai]|nr:hypothetical protein KR059_012994 [Drosophila kikkawai]